MPKFKKIQIIITIILTITMSTGCWDRKELENNAFIMAVGIDKYDEKKSSQDEEDKPGQSEKNRFKVSYDLPVFTAIKEAEAGKKSREVLISVGETSYQTTRQLTLRGDSKPFFQHMKGVILGVDVVSNSECLLEILDGLERQDEINGKIHVFIAEDQASEIIEVESNLKPLWYKLQGMSDKSLYTYAFIPKTLEEVITDTSTGVSLIPKIKASKREIKVGGSAVIKDNKFVDWLGEEETKAVAFITGTAKKDIVQITDDGVTMPYIINKIKVKKSAKVEDGNIIIDINIDTSGNMQQYKVNEKPKMTEGEFLKRLESIIEDDISKQLNTTVKKLQNDMNVDAIDISTYLRRHKPEIWKEISDDWDEVFPKLKININVNSKIDKVGAIK